MFVFRERFHQGMECCAVFCFDIFLLARSNTIFIKHMKSLFLRQHVSIVSRYWLVPSILTRPTLICSLGKPHHKKKRKSSDNVTRGGGPPQWASIWNQLLPKSHGNGQKLMKIAERCGFSISINNITLDFTFN